MTSIERDGSKIPQGSREKKIASRSKKEKEDESIMNTNNSCIVSKRSVEKIYHKEDHGFLRHFVTKFQRRSPLINRGYWLRMHAVEHSVRSFLAENREVDAIVVNLGCGYDTLPFKFLSQERDLCSRTKFVDVDYDILLRKKCNVVSSSDALREPCGTFSTNSALPTLLSGEHYTAVAADLQSKADLEKLKTALGLADQPILFLAEVSLTYMDANAVQSLIEWASSFSNPRFVLLEQYLPDGPSHPFAATMLKHFVKLHSPLKSASQYPSLEDQRRRFAEHGWPHVDVESLWRIWSDDGVVTPETRLSLGKTEPFDEWEEFMLYGAHYFLLTAHNSRDANSAQPSHSLEFVPHAKLPCFPDISSRVTRRRLGAGCLASIDKVMHHGGYGPKSRLSDTDTYIPALGSDQDHQNNGQGDPTFQHEACCHTVTRLRSGASLMVGGRLSPDKALSTCFLWSGTSWKRVEDLPAGRYRHCAVAWGEGALVIGGKLESQTLAPDWLYWEKGQGWSQASFIGDIPPLRFGACASDLPTEFTQASGSQCSALVAGGIGVDGKVLDDMWQIDLIFSVPGAGPMIRCWQPTVKVSHPNIEVSRFGAVMISQRDEIFIVGGLSAVGFVSQDQEILRFTKDYHVSPARLEVPSDTANGRNLLVGHQCTSVGPHSLLVYGGGAICFSFGSCWNDPALTVGTTSEVRPDQTWRLVQPESQLESQMAAKATTVHTAAVNGDPVEPAKVLRSQIHSSEDFDGIMAAKQPVIIADANLGSCVSTWSSDYLINAIGEDTEVVVHSSNSNTMSFLDKNFTYTKKPFGQFMRGVSEGEREYLRAISTGKPTEKATDLAEDYPSLASDFALPSEMSYVEEHAHSSPLRISGPVTMWLHYDVMSNVLCQIRGRKRLKLYHPREVSKLQFPPGASSSRLNAWDEDDSLKSGLRLAQAFEAQLEPGDILYIPALWAHTASPTDGLSVAVNVFFRDLDEGYAAGKDVYGNRDLQAYENSRKDVDRIIRSFKKLPAQCAQFYLQRLADELSDAAQSNAESGSK